MTALSANIDLIAAAVLDSGMPLPQACELVEARIIDAALLRTKGNVTQSAALLGVNRSSSRPREDSGTDNRTWQAPFAARDEGEVGRWAKF